MRLLIYLLALISGFSAAEAARADVSSSSSVVQTSVAAAEALVSQEQACSSGPAHYWPKSQREQQQLMKAVSAVASTPVSRQDVTRE